MPVALAAGYLTATRRSHRPWRDRAFVAGCVLLVAALVTPLDTLAREYLVWAHLLQNVVLAEWAPLLLVPAFPPTSPGGSPAIAVAILTHPLVARSGWRPTPRGTCRRSTTQRFATRTASCRSSTRPTSSPGCCSGGACGRTRRIGSRPPPAPGTSSPRSSSRRPRAGARARPQPAVRVLRRRGRARLGLSRLGDQQLGGMTMAESSRSSSSSSSRCGSRASSRSRSVSRK